MEPLHPYYQHKEESNQELVDCWAWCFGAFVAVVGAVLLCAWTVKGLIWLFAQLFWGS